MEQPGKQEDELADLPPLDIEGDMSGEGGDGLGVFDDDLGMEPLDLGDIDLGSDESLDDLSVDAADSLDLDLDADMAEAAAEPLASAESLDVDLPADLGDDLSDSFDEAPVLEDAPGFDDFADASDALSEEPAADSAVGSVEGDEPLSDDELHNIMPTDSGEEAGDDVTGAGTSFFDETEDETVALSEDELEDILGHTDESFFEDFNEADEETGDDTTAATLQSEEGQMELGAVASADELVPEPELHPIAPADSDQDLEPAPLDEMSFDDFDGAGDAPAADGAIDEDLVVTPFSDDELDLELSDGSDMGAELSDFDVAGDDALSESGSDAEEAESAAPGFLEEGDDDEPIALSEDELDNIMGDVEMVDAEPGDHLSDRPLVESGESSDFDLDPADDFAQADALSDETGGDMLDEISSGEDELSLDANAEDENITLSDDELSQVLLDSESTESTDSIAESEAVVVEEEPQPLDMGDSFESIDDLPEIGDADDEELPDAPSLSSLDMDDDEPIALTAEELGNIVSEVETDEVVEASGMEPGADDLGMLDDDSFGDEVGMEPEAFADEGVEEDFSPGLAGFDAAEEEGPVALSDSELGSILEDTDSEAVSVEGQTPPEDHDLDLMVADSESGEDEFADGNVIVLDEYEETAADEPVVPGPPEVAEPAEAPVTVEEEAPELAGVGGAVAAAAAAGAAAAGVGLAERAERIAAGADNLDREELRTMISYLDGLFDALPDEAVQKFSQSSYFDLYKKIMSELGL